MAVELWIALALSALGTFAMRALPTAWMRRHLDQRARAEAAGQPGAAPMPVWLSVLGPTMIAAMFGVSLVPAQLTLAHGLATVCGVVATLLVWRRTHSLGWPVIAGVLLFGLVYWLTR